MESPLGTDKDVYYYPALIAQSAERILGKDEVTGSSPVKGSTWRCSSVGQSIRFIPEVSGVQIPPPLPYKQIKGAGILPASFILTSFWLKY